MEDQDNDTYRTPACIRLIANAIKRMIRDYDNNVAHFQTYVNDIRAFFMKDLLNQLVLDLERDRGQIAFEIMCSFIRKYIDAIYEDSQINNFKIHYIHAEGQHESLKVLVVSKRMIW